MSGKTGNSLRRVATILIVGLLALPLITAQTKSKSSAKKSSQQRTVEIVKSDKKSAERRISETSTQIKSNTLELNRQLNQLNSLNADIELNQLAIEGLRNDIDSIGNQITLTADTVKMLETELEALRKSYVKAMRKIQPYSGSMNQLSFLFSSRSFSEAFNRMRYLQRFSQWRKSKAENINRKIDQIAARRLRLSELRNAQDQAFRRAAEQQAVLEKQQEASAKMVMQLRKEDVQLRKMLDDQKRKARSLDMELDRLITAEQEKARKAEEARRKQKQNIDKAKAKTAASKASTSSKSSAAKPAQSKSSSTVASAATGTAASTLASSLTGSFEANKGRLLFPVTGNYKIIRRFGRQPHPTLPHVEIDNTGIDIEVANGSSARAVFAGEVSYVLRQDGYNSIVMVRHGKYITIYAGLASVNVKQGDSVKAGQTLGRIYSDPDDDNRTKLHFEVRNERTKLNPMQWVK